MGDIAAHSPRCQRSSDGHCLIPNAWCKQTYGYDWGLDLCQAAVFPSRRYALFGDAFKALDFLGTFANLPRTFAEFRSRVFHDIEIVPDARWNARKGMGTAMFDYLQLRCKLWRLARVWDGIDGANKARLEEARKRKATREELEGIDHDSARDYFEQQDDIRAAHSKFLVSKAAQLIVPIPERKDETMWEEDYMGRTSLTKLGIITVRSAVRAESKARLEMFLMWVPGVVGILGTLIGLAAILTGKR